VQTLDVGQTITGLPLGYYTLKAIVATFGDGAPVTLTANGVSSSVAPTAEDADAEKVNGHELTVENIFVSNGTLSFRIQNTGKGQTLLKCDDFQLTYTADYVAPTEYTDLSFNISIENDEVARYLANTTYTETTASVIGNYATDAALRNDQPAAVSVPLPIQTSDATLSLALNSNFEDAVTFTVGAGSVIYDVTNLLPEKTYYYKIEADGSIIANGTITTTGQLRMMKADGIANMRDLGGWTNSDGNRIRYGKLFRGTELAGGKSYTASDADLAMLKEQLNIGAEVDLRMNGDLASGTMSASAIDGASYYYANLSRWSEDALNFDTAKFKSAFDLVLSALKAGKAAYFHCIFGADRTGCFAMLLEVLLGLPVDLIYKDYELTSFSSTGLREKTGIDHKLQYINALQGSSLQEKFYNYWRGAVGVSEADLNEFINIMVEGISPITIATLADLPTPVVADGEYYLYIPSISQFLGHGEAYGARGVGDNYGVPVQIATNGVNVSTIKFLDSNLFFGSDCYTDKVA
ncbi:MAG: tyrosine-protein phosphatase, partial [Bacteroidaceae bacterium]|nr:tyrosine-protein phosphatase [Bacteroidaceae bacterium]